MRDIVKRASNCVSARHPCFLLNVLFDIGEVFASILDQALSDIVRSRSFGIA